MPINIPEKMNVKSKFLPKNKNEIKKVKTGNVKDIVNAFVAPNSFWALKYAVSPITCPNTKLKIKIIHKISGRLKMRGKIPIAKESTINVIIPVAVRKRLIITEETSCSVCLNITFDNTKTKFASKAIISPYIPYPR
jgi:hypothetical protein